MTNITLSIRDDRYAKITSKKTRFSIIELKGDIIDKKLPFQSWVKPHRVFTIDENKIIKKLSLGNESLYKLIEKDLIKYVGFEK